MDDVEKIPTKVRLSFRLTEQEYLAAVRFYFWNSKELLVRLAIVIVAFSGGLLLLPLLADVSLPFWFFLSMFFLISLGLFHGFVIDVPRRYFRGDPKFRDEYNLGFGDGCIDFKTSHVEASYAWSFYTRVIENDKFYVMVYGHNINSLSILPKRAFRDSEQETAFREMLRRNVDPSLKLSDGEREPREYVPKSLEPPDWR